MNRLLPYVSAIIDLEEQARQSGRIMACLTDDLDTALDCFHQSDIPHLRDWFVVGFEEKLQEEY